MAEPFQISAMTARKLCGVIERSASMEKFQLLEYASFDHTFFLFIRLDQGKIMARADGRSRETH